MTPIQVRQLSAGYDGRPVLHAVDLSIPAGALCCLLGPSGCGKTTLLRCIAGLLKPSHGVIAFGDEEVTHLPSEQRRIGMVFQHYCLWPHRDVGGNVAFPLEMASVSAAERAQRIAVALRSVALPGSERRVVGELSGGQQQRVAIARALVGKPRVLLLDEPLSNLDAALRVELRDEIRRLCKESGVTAVCVTHDQHEAMAMADVMAVMVDGRLAQVGTPRSCYERPTTARVATFLGEANMLNGDVRDGVLHIADLGQIAFPGAGTVTICLRPERIRISTTGGDIPANAWSWNAQLVEQHFEGASSRLAIRVGATALRVRMLAAPALNAPSAVRAWVMPDDLITVQP